MTSNRRRTPRLTLGLRMALLPAVLAALTTIALVGFDRLARGIGEALVVGAVVVALIAIPIDRMSARPARPAKRREGRR